MAYKIVETNNKGDILRFIQIIALKKAGNQILCGGFGKQLMKIES